MPFTPSHAVIALPFLRTPLVPAAIAAGAMAPDLPLFVPFAPFGYLQTHSFAFLPVTMLVALGLLLVWRCGIRPAMRELSPQWVARRLPAEWDAGAAAAAAETFAGRGRRHPSVAGILLLAASLALGAASHIVWDLFTHAGRAGIDALDVMWGSMPAYRWLQHGSTVVGLAIIAVWAVLWLRRRDPAPPVPRVLPDGVRLAWWISLPVVLAVALAIGSVVLGPLTSQWRLEHVAYRTLPPACALWGVFTVALCLVVQRRRR